MNTYWISLPCDLLSSLASFQCSLLHHLHLSSDLGLSKYVNQHFHLNLSRNVRLSVLYDLDFNIHKSIVLLAVSIFGGFILPSPLLCGPLLRCLIRLLLVLCFLGRWFLFLLCGLAGLLCCAPTFLFQSGDFSRHGHNLLLIVGRFSPCVFLVQETCLVFVLRADHEVLCCIGSSAIVGLALEVFNIHYKFFIWCGFVCLPQVV